MDSVSSAARAPADPALSMRSNDRQEGVMDLVWWSVIAFVAAIIAGVL